ncbi:MAG: hypothetical protein M0Z53_06175 [Thermaerobacter sp.]|nr:hypothetical protein [Thermaerobacter sp.]
MAIRMALPGLSRKSPESPTGGVADIHGRCLFRPNGGVVAGVTLAPLSLALKADQERASIIQAFQAALNGLTVPWDLVSLYRPVDLDHLAELDRRLGAARGPRRKVLRDSPAWVQRQGQASEAVERRYYLFITRSGPDAVAGHRQTLRGLVVDLGRIRGFRAAPMTDADWRKCCFCCFMPTGTPSSRFPTANPGRFPCIRRREGPSMPRRKSVPPAVHSSDGALRNLLWT